MSQVITETRHLMWTSGTSNARGLIESYVKLIDSEFQLATIYMKTKPKKTSVLFIIHEICKNLSEIKGNNYSKYFTQLPNNEYFYK